MKEKIIQATKKALISSFGMTKEEAEEHVFDLAEVDDLFEFEQDELGMSEIGVEACDLTEAGHAFNLTVCYSSDYFFALLQFGEDANVAAVEEAFDKYNQSLVSDELYIENEIEDEQDALVLGFDIQGDCEKDLTHMFELLKSGPCTQLLNAVLIREKA